MGQNGKNPFQPEGVEFEIGGEKVTLKPVRISGFKEIVNIVNRTLEELSGVSEKMQLGELVGILADKYCDVMAILFPSPPYKFMTREFMEEHVTLPMARKIIETAVEQNGLSDLLPFMKKWSAGPSGVATSSAKTGL